MRASTLHRRQSPPILPFFLAALLVVQLTLLAAAPHWPLSLPAPEAPPAASQHVAAGETPAGVDAASWSDIQGQIVAGPYRAYANQRGGYSSANVAHGWQIAYEANGTTSLSPRAAGAAPWRWGLHLAGYGFGTLSTPAAPLTLRPDGQGLTYQWDAALTEWWKNGTDGLEQGFTLRSRPTGARAGEQLRVELALSGDLRAEQRGAGLALLDASGATAFTYDKLRAWDATGRDLPSRLELRGGAIVLRVSDADAIYPITIDPIVQTAYLKASNAQTYDNFGAAVAMSGDTIVVGAYEEASNATGINGDQSNNSADFAGAAYVFVRSGASWRQQAYLKASNNERYDHFGYSVAVSGDTIMVGSYAEDSNATGVNSDQSDNSTANAGAAYVFVRSGTTWSQQAYLKASNTGEGDYFGYSVGVSGDTVVVGAYYEASSATGVNGNGSDDSAPTAGAAYVFARSGASWSQQAYLKASNTDAYDFFGTTVAVSGDTVVVAAFAEGSSATGVNGSQSNNGASTAGAVYVFVRSGTAWSQQAYLKASNTGSGDYFGYSVAVSGDTVVVGALNEDSNTTGVDGDQSNNGASNAGAAYIFVRSGTTWSQQAYLKASNTEIYDNFGASVAVSGDTVVVGAIGEDSSTTGMNGDQSDNSANAPGAAYVFVRSGAIWSQQFYLKASNTEANDYFSASVAVSGDAILVGAPYESSSATGVNGDQSDNSAGNAGAVYIFDLPRPNDAPTISNLADQTIDENTATGALSLTVDDAETSAASLTLSATSDNPTLLPPGSFSFGGSDAARTITITPAANTLGSATATLSVSDGTATTSTTFTLTVTPHKEAPSFTSVAPSNLTYGASYSYTFLATGQPAPTFAVTSGSLPPGMSLSPDGTLSGTPTQVGTFAITITASNGASPAATQTFTFTIAPAALTVIADNRTRAYGAANPTLTYTTSGLVNGDTAATALTGTLATAAKANSQAGAYPITQGTLSAANYTIAFTQGTLMVEAARDPQPYKLYMPIVVR